MHNLVEIMKGLDYKVIKGNINKDISDVCYDTHNLRAYAAFVCIRGFCTDSHEMAQQAVYGGATVIVTEHEIEVTGDVTVIVVKDTREALSIMSANYFKKPADKMIMIGVTGTKGKTTTVYMIAKILENAGIKSGIIGSIEISYSGRSKKNENTTPESYIIQQTLSQMYAEGVKVVVMEVSSQGLKLKRVYGITFDYAVFTNISKDHIGKKEHETMEDYIFWKAQLFKNCRCGIYNRDDENSSRMSENGSCEKNIFYGIDDVKNISYEIVNGVPGVVCEMYGVHMEIGLPGIYSVYNALAAIKVCDEVLCEDEIETRMYLYAEVLSSFKVKGRTEMIKLNNNAYAMVDYAHNALALKSLLEAMRVYVKGRLICLFGCGGNRSMTRRYEMGETAAKYADYIIITSDNPRYENASNIMNDIEMGVLRVLSSKDRANYGLKGYNEGRYILIEDRKDAIEMALSNSEENDMIVIAGKGHEDYQEIRGRRYHLDDREIVNMYNESRTI